MAHTFGFVQAHADLVSICESIGWFTDDEAWAINRIGRDIRSSMSASGKRVEVMLWFWKKNLILSKSVINQSTVH